MIPKNANTEIYDKTLDRAAMIRLYERRVNGKIELVLNGHVVRTDKLIRDAILSQKGFEAFREAVDQELFKTFKEVYATSKRSLLDLATDQVSFAYQTIENSMGHIWRTERPKMRIAEDLVLKRPIYSDKTLEAGWHSISLGEKKRLENVIRKGMAEGKNVNQIALDVRKGNIHNITMNQSRGLVVTAITSVKSQADQAVYMANEKAIQGWQYVAVLDSRTTPLCAHRDGTIYPVEDTSHLPPAHFHCRSTTVPVFKSWGDMGSLEGVSQVRKRNLAGLSKEQIAFYDGQTPLKESYNDWLLRQPRDVQLRHLGDYKKVELFNSHELSVDKFTNAEGNSIGINELRAMTGVAPMDTKRFASAKQRLDSMRLWATTPDDFINDPKLQKTLKDYYLLQAGELDGTLSLTNYRGNLLHTKAATKRRVLQNSPTEEQLKYNPITGRYDDTRMFQPSPETLVSRIHLIENSTSLLDDDKMFLKTFIDDLEDSMSVNERAVVADNLRIMFTRYRVNKELWTNFKAVSQSQLKFDLMNISDYIETQVRKDSDLLKKLLQDNYIDPVLGPVQLQSLHDSFIDNIFKRNKWEDTTAPKIARELRGMIDTKIPPKIRVRMSDRDLQGFYLRFAHRLSLADSPDRDQLAIALGRDLHNAANLNGSRNEWYKVGVKLLDDADDKGFYKLETFGVQKRRMKSRNGGRLFGPYYETFSVNLRIVDPRIQEYAKLTRSVDIGLRVSVTDPKNQLIVREGYKTYFVKRGLGYSDTRIPITSTGSFSDFPVEFIDKNMADALNWASEAKYKVDPEFHNFIKKLLYFEDDKGKATYFNELNTYKHYIAERGDSYERFKAMEWLTDNDKAFSNHPFLDHRARIYERGLIGPQSGETFRPFLNTEDAKILGVKGFKNLQDQIGAFIGGLDDYFEGNYNSLTFTGRQKIAEKWRPEMVKLGNHMLRAKPGDIRAVLESEMFKRIDGEDLGKFMRFAMETAKLDGYLSGNYTRASLSSLDKYKTALALEQDASSSGAQIIALTTRNKQLAELSNVVPTSQKQRLYDEIAGATYDDPRFKELNKKFGLTEKDLRKASKAQNMVTFYGAGVRTGILNVEGKLSKILGKEGNTLVVKAADRDTVLNEISARMARYEKFDQETYLELKQLRTDVKDIFNKGTQPGDEILEQLYFLDSKTKDLVTKLSANYDRVVTPDDFAQIAAIMSDHLREQVPILKDFTSFFGRLAEDYLTHAKPSNSNFDWKSIAKTRILPHKKGGYKLPDRVSEVLGLKAGEPVSEKILKRFGFWKPNGTLDELINGVADPKTRRIGAKYMKVEVVLPIPNWKKKALATEVEVIPAIEVFEANKLPKSWTNVPWINFDGKTIEQNFTQSFEERLRYKDKNGNWITNIIQVPQKTNATWWDQIINRDGKINDIADAMKARTAYAVNGNHSNDATIVKRFHLWGRNNNVQTGTIHDAFFANAADMLSGRKALREIYADTLKRNIIRETLLEMRKRGLPEELYEKYLNEAIEKGLIPISRKSMINGKYMTDNDILNERDILRDIPEDFSDDFGWYGVG